MLDIGSVFDYVNVAGNLILPVDDAPLLTHDRRKYLLLEARYKLRVRRYVLNDEEHVIVNGVLILLRELPVKGKLQEALLCHVLQRLVELNHRLTHQQLPGILRDHGLRKGKRLQRGVVVDHLLPALVEDRDLALVLLMEIALHVQHKEHSLTAIPSFSIYGVSLDLVDDEFDKTHMRLIGDVVCIKNEYGLCLRLIELMQLLNDFLLGFEV